jgi:sugar O-acyltransferase (sialic acid O-acetyltransferase NeuD family)
VVRELFILGAGGFSRETAEAVRAVNAVTPTWRLRGFLDDSPALDGASVGGVPVLGPIDRIHDHPDAAVVVTTGRPDNYVSRKLIVERLGLADERYATIIHPTATVGDTCSVGVGSVLLAHTDLTADVVVGHHVAVMPQVVLPHDVRIADFATLASGVRLGGGCTVAQGAYVGAGACLRQGLEIGAWAMIGMAAVVTCDVPARRMWWGSPARDAGPAPLPTLMLESA